MFATPGTGLIGLFVLLLLIVGGVRIGIALGLVGIGGLVLVLGAEGALIKAGIVTFDTLTGYGLGTLPLFLVAGSGKFQGIKAGKYPAAITQQFGEKIAFPGDVKLFADVLHDLAKTVSSVPPADAAHRGALRDAAKALYLALDPERNDKVDLAQMSADDEVKLLHVME